MASEYERFVKVKGTKMQSATAATYIVTQATVNNNVTNTADVLVQFLRAAYGPDATKPGSGTTAAPYDFGRSRQCLIDDLMTIIEEIKNLKTWPPA